MSAALPDVVDRYFETDAGGDVSAVVALFTEDAVVIDEDRTWRGTDDIRSWREGVASRYEYTAEVLDAERTGDVQYLVTGRLEGNFPGGVADVTWRFTIADDRIKRLHIS